METSSTAGARVLSHQQGVEHWVAPERGGGNLRLMSMHLWSLGCLVLQLGWFCKITRVVFAMLVIYAGRETFQFLMRKLEVFLKPLGG